jgi:hypothetical protein
MNKYGLVANICEQLFFAAENYLDDPDDANGENAYIEELMTALEFIQELGEYADESLILEKQEGNWNIWWNNEDWYVFAQVIDEDTYHFEVHEEGEFDAEILAIKFAPHILKAKIQDPKLTGDMGDYWLDTEIAPMIRDVGNYQDNDMIIEITDDEATLYYKDDIKAIKIVVDEDATAFYDIIYFSDAGLLKEILAKFEEK